MRALASASRWIRCTPRLLAACTLATTLAVSAWAQRPRRDVVEVPASGPGLCVSNLFQSHMVLQRDRPVALWGWAEPGERVTVEFGAAQAGATADAGRRWLVTLPAMEASTAPRRLTVQGATETLELEDVLVGDVWLLGGQSNMEFELAKVENGPLEIASANYPLIRVLTVPYGVGPEPLAGFARLDEWSDWFGRHFRKGDWDVCTPAVARELSAIGFAFARRVHMASGVPIGVIDASRGGTTVEAWTPLAVLRELDSAPVRGKLAEWQDRVAAFEPEPDAPSPGPIADPNYPGNSFAGMIGPLVGLSIKGALFHQGFNNALDGMPGVRLYRDVFPAMIRAWRAAFGDPVLPFGILSLCTEGLPQTRENALECMLDAGVFIRAVQYETFRELHASGDPGIGFASTYDLRRRWYHPQLKLPAGERLARWALATQYGFGDTLEWRPPMLVGLEARDGALLLRLDTEVADPEDGAITGFVIAGADGRFQPAEVAYVQVGEDDRGRPRLDRAQLLLTSPLVPEPLHFRYAWARNPLANLQAVGNKDLPFGTQRSDDWDLSAIPPGVLDDPVEGRLSRPQRAQLLEALRREDTRRRIAEARDFLARHPEVPTEDH
jgi:sialate O-acetylesterase